MTTTITDRLVAAAVADAYAQLRIADDLNLKDHKAVIASQASLAAILRRVLWTIDEAEDTRDRAAGVPHQVAVEDAVAAEDEELDRFQWSEAA
ncbi:MULTISPECIES: hypothetical protein [unclassified Streptomyces]|uniref:hypothetical protein n=1 Tax=unclassified Streptomyces TaxID=2593676 RepID=UPI000BEFA0B4|nr:MULTISPECIES: hypothetical protein [unclassified Streptomyces]